VRFYVLFMLLFGLSCGKSDEWCDKFVETACDCEATIESDLCQDAEVIAGREDEDSCEERYYRLPSECLLGPPLSPCFIYAANICDCKFVSAAECDAYREYAERSEGDSEAQAYCEEEQESLPASC